MLSSSNIGLELPRDIDPCVNWKKTKGKKRAVRRARSSVAGESNRQKAATTSSNGSENASDEEFKEGDQVLASESEKLGVKILTRRFSDTFQNVPIKKRMRVLNGSPAPLPLDSSQASTLEAGSASFVEGSLDNHVDFSGISILAEAACKSDLPDEDTNFPVSEVQSPKGENGVVMSLEASEVQSPGGTAMSLEGSSSHIETAKEVLNDGSDKSSKQIKFHWDLNTVMDDWDQQEDGNGEDDEQKTASVACNNEVCNNQKEEPEKMARNENHESTIRNNGDVLDIVAPKESCELLGTELRKEGNIVIEVSPKDSIVESITPCPVPMIPPFGPSSAKEEVKSNNGPYSNQLSASEHEQLSMELTTGPELISEECTKEPVEIKEEVNMSGSITKKPLEVNPQLDMTTGPELISEECTKEPVEIKEDIKMPQSITDKPLEVNPQLELSTGPEPISEECTKEPVASAPYSEPKDSVMGNDPAGNDAMMGGNKVEHDSITGDDKLEHSARQSDCDQLAEEKNLANPSHIETGLMPIIGNDGGHNTVDTEKVEKVDLSVSDKMGIEVDRHGSSVELPNDGDHSDFCPPKKDLEEDDYQYEDGELREPAMPYWGIDGFNDAETERGHREADERGNYLMEPLPDAPVMGSVTLDAPQGEEKLLVADTSMQIDDCMGTNMIAKMDLESEDQTERLENDQANNLGENSIAEYMHNSREKSTGWDKQPESSSKNSGSPLKQESRPDSSRREISLSIDTLRSTDDPLRNDNSFVRSRRSREDDSDARPDWNPRAPRMCGRGGPSRQSNTSRRDEHWVETRINTGRTHHRTTEFGAPSYAPSNSGNATAASIAKVKSNGFMVAPDGTLVKTGASGSSRKCQNSSPFYHGTPTERDHRGFRSSRERVISPDRFGGTRGGRPGRCAAEPAREPYHRPVIEISPGPRRQRSFSPHRGHIRHISPSHIGSPSRSRTRSPNAWVSPTAGVRCLADHEPRHERGRSPLHRMGPDYGDRPGALNLVHRNHHHFPSHGPRCVNDRRCTSPVNLMRRSPPRDMRFHPLDSPPPPLHRQRDEFYHHPVHSGQRCNGFDHRRGFEEDQYEMVRAERFFERNVNGEGFRPRYSSQKSFEAHRSSPRGRLNRGLGGDVNHRGKDRDSFKFGRGGGRRTNGKYEKREMRDRNGGGGDDDAAERRRLS